MAKKIRGKDFPSQYVPGNTVYGGWSGGSTPSKIFPSQPSFLSSEYIRELSKKLFKRYFPGKNKPTNIPGAFPPDTMDLYPKNLRYTPFREWRDKHGGGQFPTKT